MVTALLILVACFLTLALVGVCCQIAGGGFFAVFHLLNNSIGKLLELLCEVVAAIADGLKG
jgi:hypothetical protein